MSKVEDGLFQLDAHARYGDALPAEIRGIHAYASYHSGWIDTDFLYERPRIIIELDTDCGTIHADIHITTITDGNCYELLDALTPVDTGVLDVREMIGETVYLAPNDDFTKATLAPNDDPDLAYDRDRSVVLRELDSLPAQDDGARSLGTEARSLDWLNRQLLADYERHVASHNGWLERTIDTVAEDDDTVRVLVPVFDGWRARWEFDNSFRGHLALREFAQQLGLPADADELEGAIVYLHPVRDLHHTLPRSEFPIDALERWVIAGDPLEPQPTKKSWLDRLRSALSPSKPRVSTSVGGRTRHAKSSDDFDVRDECRSTTSGTADTQDDGSDAVCVLPESLSDA